MATKVTGLAWTTLQVADSGGTARDIRNAITNLTFATPRGVQDVTGIDKSAYERLLLLADFTMTLNGVFDVLSTTGAHAVFSTVPTTSANRSVTIETNGKTLTITGAIASDYAITRANSGELTFSVPMSNSDGAVPTWS